MKLSDKKKDIKEMFEVFDDPMDKYVQIIELGKKILGFQMKIKMIIIEFLAVLH